MATTILSPCGILGYGFSQASFEYALQEHPDAIVVDAGSTDAGPHKLGAGTAIVSRTATKLDLRLLMHGARSLGIPLIIGSAGGSGARQHTEWTYSIIEELAREQNIPCTIAVVWADVCKQAVWDAQTQGRITKMSPNVPDITEASLRETNGIVAQMGTEPILRALKSGADIILCGRAYDPAPFAAVGLHHGHDEALCYHLGKILECGAMCAEPGTAKDCMLGVLDDTGFEVYPADPGRKCTPVSVAAHTFYEKEHPFLLKGPGILLDLSGCRFEPVSDRRVRVTGSKCTRTDYTVKLEGARKVAYRAFVLAGIRDPLLINQLDAVEAEVEQSVRTYYSAVPTGPYQINFYHYGKNAVMGGTEPCQANPHEVGLMFEVIAQTQEVADMVCASVRSTYLHHGYPGRISTAGNLAFPFAPSDIAFGPVYAFSVYHLMKVEDACAPFPIELREVTP